MEQIVTAHAEKPLDFAIVSGDLTKDGALSSHEEFAGYKEEIEQAGIPVFDCPGNHFRRQSGSFIPPESEFD